MQYLILYLISFCLFSCKESKTESNIKSEVTKNHQEVEKPFFDLGDFVLYIDADEEDFDISNVENDTIKIKKSLYKNLDGGVLKPKEGLKILNISENILIDVLQYTIDDNPASPLDLNIKKELNKNEVRFYTFESAKKYAIWLHDIHYGKIKEKSIYFQNKFFLNLQENKIKYLDCCKEYITQAEDFLKSDKNILNDFKSLHVEPIIKQRIIKIKYINKNNLTKEKIILYN